MTKIWITRPLGDATRFCKDLDAAQLPVSLTPTIYSLLDVEFLEIDAERFLKFPAIGAFVATSRNGVRALSQMKDFEKFSHLPFFTVGKATGELARSFGFKDIRVGPGRAEELLPLICEYDRSYDDSDPKRILNLRGDEQAFHLKAAIEADLTSMNNQFEDVLCYRMKEANELSEEVLNELKNNGIRAVVLMSPRTARVYGSLMKFYDFKREVAQIQHFCLSEAVADVLRGELVDPDCGFDLPAIEVSSFPSQSHMIDCIKKTYSD